MKINEDNKEERQRLSRLESRTRVSLFSSFTSEIAVVSKKRVKAIYVTIWDLLLGGRINYISCKLERMQKGVIV